MTKTEKALWNKRIRPTMTKIRTMKVMVGDVPPIDNFFEAELKEISNGKYQLKNLIINKH